MTRQTSRQTFRQVEREIRADKEMASYIRATYAPTTIINKIASKNYHDDILRTKASALLAGCQLKNWYQAFTPVR